MIYTVYPIVHGPYSLVFQSSSHNLALLMAIQPNQYYNRYSLLWISSALLKYYFLYFNKLKKMSRFINYRLSIISLSYKE